MDLHYACQVSALAAVLRSVRFRESQQRVDAPAPTCPTCAAATETTTERGCWCPACGWVLEAPEPDAEYELRRIYREFCAWSGIPLDRVYDLPVEFVLQHHWERRFEEAEGDEPAPSDRDQRTQLQRWRDLLAESAEERAGRLARERAERRGHDDFAAHVRQKVADGTWTAAGAAKKVSEQELTSGLPSDMEIRFSE